jgi:hypothetical protein
MSFILNLNNNKKKVFAGLIMFAGLNTFSQTIVNTENMSTKTDSVFSLISSIEGNWSSGNIELIQINSANQIAFKKNKTLLKLFLNYEYISQSKETISSDYTSQLRYSYVLKNNSFFSFIQGQKAVSLSLNSRYLVGVGYKHRIINKKENHLDMALGPFYENERYLKNEFNETHITNYRYSFSTFYSFKISEKLTHNAAIYYQINTDNFKDYRFYIEPRIVYKLDTFKIYTTLKYRHHSTPYVPVKSTDTQWLFGVNYEFGLN